MVYTCFQHTRLHDSTSCAVGRISVLVQLFIGGSARAMPSQSILMLVAMQLRPREPAKEGVLGEASPAQTPPSLIDKAIVNHL